MLIGQPVETVLGDILSQLCDIAQNGDSFGGWNGNSGAHHREEVKDGDNEHVMIGN